jgi:hypothetical protein
MPVHDRSSGLFHVFGDDDRRRYIEGLASVLKPGGRLFMLCFSDAEPGESEGDRGRLRPGLGDRVRRAVPVRGPARSERQQLPGRWPEGVVRGGEEGEQSMKRATLTCRRAWPLDATMSSLRCTLNAPYSAKCTVFGNFFGFFHSAQVID